MVRRLYFFLIDNAEILPKEYSSVVEKEGIHHVVCDYIAGMTDRYAVNVFKKIYIPNSWRE